MIHQPPAAIGKYRIERELGRGGMGVVYQAFDTVVERPVAIKTIGHGDAPARLLSRLKREAKAVGQLDHPNIVSLYDAGETDGLFYMVMQLVHGETLHQRISRRWDFSLQEILTITRQLLQALAYAHARGVVHRDIKPANIMITPEGVVKVADFGVAKFTDTGNSSSGLVMGTPSYMSPEQIQGRTVDARSDIFSLGCVLYELVTGKKAFAGNDTTSIIYKIVHEAPPPPNIIVPGMPRCIETLILKALTKKPDDRFNSCASFERALEACVACDPKSNLATPHPSADTPSAPLPVGSGHSVTAFSNWNRPVVWISALLGILCALLVALLLMRPTSPLRTDVQTATRISGNDQQATIPQPQPPSHQPDPPPSAQPVAIDPQPMPRGPAPRPPKPRPSPLPPVPNTPTPSPEPKPSLPPNPSGPSQPGGDLPSSAATSKAPILNRDKPIDPVKLTGNQTHAASETLASLMLRGDIACAENRYPEALVHYLQASRLDPANRSLRHKLAVAYTMLGQTELARQYSRPRN